MGVEGMKRVYLAAISQLKIVNLGGGREDEKAWQKAISGVECG